MYDYFDAWTNVVADVEVEPAYDGIDIKLAVDVAEQFFDTTEEQDDAISAAMQKHARALEQEVAEILGAPLRETN